MMKVFTIAFFAMMIGSLAVQPLHAAAPALQASGQSAPPISKSGAPLDNSANQGTRLKMCRFLFARFTHEYKTTTKPISQNNGAATSCSQQFKEICGNEKSQERTALLSMTAGSKDYKDINSKDIARFCAAPKTE